MMTFHPYKVRYSQEFFLDFYNRGNHSIVGVMAKDLVGRSCGNPRSCEYEKIRYLEVLLGSWCNGTICSRSNPASPSCSCSGHMSYRANENEDYYWEKQARRV
jgi:hypothetical protein